MIDALFPIGLSQYVIGGLFVGLGICLPFIVTGIVAGMSTFYTAMWSYTHSGWFFQKERYIQSRSWRLFLAFGVVLGGLLYYLFVAGHVAAVTDVHPLRLFIGGVCIGIGSRMSGGCTSGHAICGIAALERVSVVATLIFLSVAIIVAYITSLFLTI